MADYTFSDKGFVIDRYDEQKPFSSFLPGVAGKKGIPLWAFYVNRGQGIASFGSKDKNGAIMEFFPANAAYIHTDRIGFRTFIKVDGVIHEFFSSSNLEAHRQMIINPSELTISEYSDTLDFKVTITYFGLPSEPIAALVRHVTIDNLSAQKRHIEVLDGMPSVLPAGIDYNAVKSVSNLMRSWMEATNLENNIPFYTLRASTKDHAEVGTVEVGNFFFSTYKGTLLHPIVDPNLIFNQDTAFQSPKGFANQSVTELQKAKQVTTNKFACAFAVLSEQLKGEQSLQFQSYFGYAHNVKTVNKIAKTMLTPSYGDAKMIEARHIIQSLTKVVKTKTAHPLFDAYIEQCYLDNILRGGAPLVFKGKNRSIAYHLYSRKHGDLERDYNFFSIAPEYYSQGNGNFRDVCQNRRNDTIMHPDVEDYNVFVFGNLIQIDGYNPLGIQGLSFRMNDLSVIDTIIDECFVGNYDKIKKTLTQSFTPGGLINFIERENIKLKCSEDEFLAKILMVADENVEAEFGEGYWQDHFTYILDLIENHQMIYPERLHDIMFASRDYKYYDSPARILPRHEKTVLTKDGKVRQFGSLIHYDADKAKRVLLKNGTNWLKDKDGLIVKTNLFSKCFILAVNKFATLDSEGIGIEYEANKPGWNDAMNGVPGLFGSGVGEAIELARLVDFLHETAIQYMNETMSLPIEFIDFLDQIFKINTENSFSRWDCVTNARETFREDVRFGIVGQKIVAIHSIVKHLKTMQSILSAGRQKAIKVGNGILPTFLVREAKEYDPIFENGKPRIGHYGLPLVRVNKFELRALPTYLEAPARYLKYKDSAVDKYAMWKKLKETDIYDHSLKMYKTSVCLDSVSHEIGRARAFTKGWLERESNFLHMTYKYLLGLLKAKLYDVFFEEVETNLVCFMDPSIYGRPTTENSSFIAPANNPDPAIHGQGFYARLSGSTAEVLSMWALMFFGENVFRFEHNELVFCPKPILPASYFAKDDTVETTLLGHTKLKYYNPDKIDTYSPQAYISSIECKLIDETATIDGSEIKGKLASLIRKGGAQEIRITIKKSN